MSETNLQLFPGVFRSTVGGENPGFFLHSDGRVGIGNKAPTTKPLWSSNSADRNKLNVTGHTHIDGNLNVTGHLYGDGSTLSGVAAVIGGYWDLDASNNNIKYEAGNVGIGGAASTESLTIYGDLNIKNSGQLKFDGADAVFSKWSSDTNGIYRPSNVGIGGVPSATNKLKVHGTVEASGNVGIGESDPDSILHVQSDVQSGTGGPIKKTAASAATSGYNYILNGPRPGTTTSGAVHFINGSGRSTDGGTSTYTMRNDSGNTRVGNSSYSTIIAGAHSFPNRPIAVVGRNNLPSEGQRNTYPHPSGIFVFNHTLINSGIYNTSNGRFTAPSGYGGYYLLSFTGLGAYYNTNAPNTRWYVNGSVHNYGAYHTNLGGMSGTPAHVGISGMNIINLAAGQYVDLRVHSGTLYGQSTLHAYAVCLYLGAA